MEINLQEEGKLWYTYTMEYYTSVKTKRISMWDTCQEFEVEPEKQTVEWAVCSVIPFI